MAPILALAPQYYGSVYYYAAMSACKQAIVDTGLRYDKRFKSVHRCDIVDTRGQLRLTVPVSKNVEAIDNSEGVRNKLRWGQVRVSSHGQWWSDHQVSLESAYGRTPFFEFYIDRLQPFLRDVNMSIVEMDCEIDKVIRSILHLDTDVKYIDCSNVDIDNNTLDFRRNNFPPMRDIPYYQVRAQKLGFVPGLSILDLIFNLGPESPLILRQMTW